MIRFCSFADLFCPAPGEEDWGIRDWRGTSAPAPAGGRALSPTGGAVGGRCVALSIPLSIAFPSIYGRRSAAAVAACNLRATGAMVKEQFRESDVAKKM